jgi:DNA-binding MarR family transcriptional regulator
MQHGTTALQSLFLEVIALAGRLKRPMLPQAADLAVSARRVLQVLAHEGALTVPQIGRMLGTSRQNIQVIVNRLKIDGLVDVILNPAHERSVLVEATQSGKSLVTPSTEEETQLFGQLISRFSSSEVAAATELLHEIRLRLGTQTRQSVSTSGEMPIASVKDIRPVRETNSRPLTKAVAAVEHPEAEEYELPVNLL